MNVDNYAVYKLEEILAELQKYRNRCRYDINECKNKAKIATKRQLYFAYMKDIDGLEANIRMYKKRIKDVRDALKILKDKKKNATGMSFEECNAILESTLKKYGFEDG